MRRRHALVLHEAISKCVDVRSYPLSENALSSGNNSTQMLNKIDGNSIKIEKQKGVID